MLLLYVSVCTYLHLFTNQALSKCGKVLQLPLRSYRLYNRLSQFRFDSCLMLGQLLYCGLQIYLVTWAHVSLALCSNRPWCMWHYMRLPIAFWDNQQISLADLTEAAVSFHHICPPALDWSSVMGQWHQFLWHLNETVIFILSVKTFTISVVVGNSTKVLWGY